MLAYAYRFRFSALALAAATTAACVVDDPGDLADLETDSLEAAATQTIFSSTALTKGASKTGTFVAPEAGTLTFATSGTGDADLYVKRGAVPSTTSADCKSEGSTSTESCALAVAAGESIGYRVYAYAASTVTLTAATAPAPQTTTTVLVPSGAIAKGATRTGVYTVGAPGSIVFRTAGSGDVDLYVRKGSAPTTTTADCKSEGATAVETCTFTAATGDRLYYLVYGYAASTASLTVTAPAGAPDYARTLALPNLPSTDAFTAFSQAGGVLASSGRSLKFLIDNRTPTARTINFLNGNYTVNGAVPDYARYHYDFARRTYGISDSVATFNQSTYFTQAKRFFAGTVQTYQLATGPVYAVQFYPDDVIAEETVLDALTTIKPLIAIPGARVAFVATGPQQTTARITAGAAALGVELMTIDQVLGKVTYVGLNPGEAWGYLRIFPADPATLRATDIPVFDELPLDLSVVAGVITRAYQDINSHVNLKSKERGTPNMVLRDTSATDPRLLPWADQPVHLTVTGDGFRIEATTAEIVQAKLAERLNRPWVTLPVVDESRLLGFDDLCPDARASCLAWADRLGGKATGLGFLAAKQAVGRAAVTGSLSARYGYDLSPQGFAIPVQGYRDFVNAPENALLKAKIDAFVVAEKRGDLAPADRLTLTKEIQELFYKGHLAPAALTAINARLAAVLPGVGKFKFRSSATSEDIENFNGAGLYDSFSAELSKTDNPDFSCALNPEYTNGVLTNLKMKPKTVQCAIKGVYASLWNPRAVDERSFARLDHATAGMGIAVNPSYDAEDAVVANLVLVTRVLGSDVYGYTLSVQKDNILVTNPDPGTIAEMTVAAFSDADRPPRFTTTRYATPVAGQPALTTTVLTETQMREVVEMARTVETAYCTAKATYFPGGSCSSVWLSTSKPRALDMEIKVLANGHYVLKQVREFHGR